MIEGDNVDRDDVSWTQAERLLQRRSMEKLSAAITDPGLRAQARQLASGAIAPAEFVKYMEQSAPAMRAFDRYLKRYMSLTAEDIDRIGAERERQVREVAAELQVGGAGAVPPQPVPRGRRRREEDEPPWEEGSWLE
jgi:hypothetical protein